jgi:molybdenum cofactor cytidylyltransferase
MAQPEENRIYTWLGAVVLAAGRSTRMGQPKQLLQWGQWTVIEQVVDTLRLAGVGETVVVTGAVHEQVEAALRSKGVKTVYNPDYAAAEMLTSLKVGLRALSSGVEAALVVLGDQPGSEPDAARAVADAFRKQQARLVVPSYQMRRGHPWLLARSLWPDLLALPQEKTLRDFLNENSREILYVEVNSPAILKDLDTPEDYQEQHPKL